MDISFEKGISKNNALLLCKWSNKMGRGFQEQWMGAKVSYPLSYDKIKELENTFSIFTEGQFIGMIQKVRIDKDNIHIGRFVLEPEKTGSGLGTAALRKFISLSVFDFNQNAKRVYEKLGFEVAELIETPKLKYTMKKIR